MPHGSQYPRLTGLIPSFLFQCWCFRYAVSVSLTWMNRFFCIVFGQQRLNSKMKKAPVNWPVPDYTCPKPRAKFPAVTVGGLPPPTFAKCSSRPVVLPSGSPCQPPPPRPLPLSLRPQEPVPAKVGHSTASVATPSQQRSLVLPTSLPPDMCRESRGAFTTSLPHWHTAKQVYERWLGELVCSIGLSSWICREFSQQKTFPTVIR